METNHYKDGKGSRTRVDRRQSRHTEGETRKFREQTGCSQIRLPGRQKWDSEEQRQRNSYLRFQQEPGTR